MSSIEFKQPGFSDQTDSGAEIEALIEDFIEDNGLELNSRVQKECDFAMSSEASLEEKQSFLAKLKTMVARKNDFSGISKIYKENKTKEEQEYIENMFRENWQLIESQLRSARSTPSEFIGNGRVGEVYNFRAAKGFCFKFVHDSAAYAELDFKGNRVQNRMEEEGEYLEDLENLEVDGVHTPAPYFYISNGDIEGIAMVRMDAVDFARVFEGHDELPVSFDFERYFSKLERYFQAMHGRGIVHKDIAARNLMIDKTNGDPRVIDFGKARRKSDYLLGEKSFEEVVGDEWIMFEKTKKEIKEKLDKLK